MRLVKHSFSKALSSSPLRGAPKVQGSVYLAQRGNDYGAWGQRWPTGLSIGWGCGCASAQVLSLLLCKALFIAPRLCTSGDLALAVSSRLE